MYEDGKMGMVCVYCGVNRVCVVVWCKESVCSSVV